MPKPPDPDATGTERTRATGPGGKGVFATTHWSVVLQACRDDTTRSRAALEELCRAYWHPLYHYVRLRGYGLEDAQDLTQSFFARLLEHGTIGKAERARGRFRSFLLVSLKNFLADQRDRATAQKRGGGRVVLSLDFHTEERFVGAAPVDSLTPDRAYEKRWATALLEGVYRRLEAEFEQAGKGDQFDALRVTLTAPRGTTPYARLAAQLNMREGAVKVAVHRLRQRYREILREKIQDTVATPDEVEDELRHLMSVLSG